MVTVKDGRTLKQSYRVANCDDVIQVAYPKEGLMMAYPDMDKSIKGEVLFAIKFSLEIDTDAVDLPANQMPSVGSIVVSVTKIG